MVNRRHDGTLTALLPAEGRIALITEPSQVIPRLLASVLETVPSGPSPLNLALVPSSRAAGEVLATPAAAYIFDAQALHLAGGFDFSLDTLTMAMDAQARLTGRLAPARTLASDAVTGVPAASVDSYLNVLSGNVTASVLSPLLAPLFIGLVDSSFKKTGTDTSAIDLQRSPGGDDIGTLSVPTGAFEGTRVVRNWDLALKETKARKEFNSLSRRIPARRLPHLDEFVTDLWHAAGISDARRTELERAFADTRQHRPDTLFAARTDNEAAIARLTEVAAAYNQRAYWWDPDKQELHIYSDGKWVETADSLGDAALAVGVVYLIDAHLREVPFVPNTSAVVIVDFTVTNIPEVLRKGWVGRHALAFVAAPTTAFTETLVSLDFAISASEDQHDLLLGALAATKRLSQYTYDENHSLGNLVATEHGTEVALRALHNPSHPFDIAKTIPEYEKTPYEVKAAARHSITESLKEVPGRLTRRGARS